MSTTKKKPEKEKLMSFHFDCGNSSKGTVGFCGRIRAHSKEEALEIMKRVLPDEQKLDPVGDDDDNAAVEYLEAYLNADAIKIKNIDDVEEVEEE
jgi:hypothetical protein